MRANLKTSSYKIWRKECMAEKQNIFKRDFTVVGRHNLIDQNKILNFNTSFIYVSRHRC